MEKIIANFVHIPVAVPERTWTVRKRSNFTLIGLGGKYKTNRRCVPQQEYEILPQTNNSASQFLSDTQLDNNTNS